MPRVRRPPPRRRRGRLVAGGAALVLAFLAGIALGEALHDNPKDGGSRTFVRTFEPFAATETVTVTTTGP